MKILIVCGDINGNTVVRNIFNERIIYELAKTHEVTVITDCSSLKNRKLCVKSCINHIKLITYADSTNRWGNMKVFIKNFFLNKSSKDNIEEDKKLHVTRKYNKAFKFLCEKRVDILYPVYRGKHKWIKNASTFLSDIKYDLVISISHPPACHQVVYNLIKKRKIQYSKWIQIWQEPWFQRPKIAKETHLINRYEKMFIQAADYVFFSSEFLKEYFSDKYKYLKKKIDYLDLPADSNPSFKPLLNEKDFTIGYFGAYFSKVRNILPFYKTLCKLDLKSMIVGASDLDLCSVKNLHVIPGSIPLEECEKLEKEMHCLTIIGNNFTDILPGKIYNYCGMEKPILFILDGTDKGIAFTRKKFEKYKNIYFCSNKISDIEAAINRIIGDLSIGVRYDPVDDFSSYIVANKMLNIVKEC